jgi:hypothetical protein
LPVESKAREKLTSEIAAKVYVKPLLWLDKIAANPAVKGWRFRADPLKLVSK